MLNGSTFKNKDEWRSVLAARRLEIADKPARSERAVRRILPLLKGNVLVYVSMGSELCTSSLIKTLLADKNVAVYAPYTVNGEIEPRRVISVGEPDKWGNMPIDCYASEPCGKERDKSIKIDYCVTPLLGFNRDGYRIGYGRGCYDKFFARCETYKIGLAFDEQLADFAPTDNDVPLDCCVTEKKVIYFEHEGNSG